MYNPIHALNKNCATIHSFISLTNVDRFSIFFTVMFSVKFATTPMSHLNTSKVLLHYTLQNTKDGNWQLIYTLFRQSEAAHNRYENDITDLN